MKKALFLLFVMTIVLSAQNSGEVDVQSILDGQINKAQSNMAEFNKKKMESEEQFLPAAAQQPEGISLGVTAFVVLSVFMFSAVIIRRYNKKIKQAKKKNLKTRVIALREERLTPMNNPVLRQTRGRLGRADTTVSLRGKEISVFAKEMNLSKGEVLLAARLKAHEKVKNNKTKDHYFSSENYGVESGPRLEWIR